MTTWMIMVIIVGIAIPVLELSVVGELRSSIWTPWGIGSTTARTVGGDLITLTKFAWRVTCIKAIFLV